jgi:UDP-N-acetyl-D-mannosaminuronic acid dehydrogenase
MSKVVVVGGGGHVGLPFALVLAECGYEVVSLDISEKTVDLINSGSMPFLEAGAQELLEEMLEKKRFKASLDHSELVEAEIVVIVIGTPIDEHLNPDPNSVVNVISKCIPYLNSSQLVLLRSTVFPGVTARVSEILYSFSLEPDLVFCPERILEGHALRELKELPQIIGASSTTASERSMSLFEKLGVKTFVVTPEEAELAKLFTNVWRYIKFAAANQFWLMSNEAGMDYSKIREAITFDYPRASDLPNAGFTAGPCLFKDTMQLAAFSNNSFGLGHSAMLINEGMPLYIVSKLEEKHDLKKLTVGILGMSFKGESDDIRSSLAYKLKKILLFKAAKVVTSDPYVKVDGSLITQEELLSQADIIVIGAPHKIYQEIHFQKPVIDVWDLLGKGNLI